MPNSDISTSLEGKTAFVTSAWEADWEAVLHPKRMSGIIASQRADFVERVVVLNNFASLSQQSKARRAARKLINERILTQFLEVEEILTDDALERFHLVPSEFWKNNPWYSTAHLSALTWLRERSRWMFFINGDVWLAHSGEWLPRALAALSEHPEILGLNLCRNIYEQTLYPERCSSETTDLWIHQTGGSDPPQTGVTGFGLSDLAYLLPVSPPGGWDFEPKKEYFDALAPNWPKYAMPCFELYYRISLERRGMAHGALKPRDGVPITKHKNYPRGRRMKFLFYYWTGQYFPGGRYCTPSERAS